MDKIAYIILAHQDSLQLKRLICSLDFNADFYVHIDAKSSMSPFLEALDGMKNVFFIVKRKMVHWGSFGHVLVQKELLRTVFESGINYARVVALSGMDYPIWPTQRIYGEFTSNKVGQFIMGYNLSQTKIKPQIEKVTVYHFFRDLKVRSRVIKGLFCRPSRFIMKRFPIRKKRQTTLFGIKADVYMGSDMWSLTYECAKFVYKSMCEETALMNYFKYSFVPSEMVVQTIVFNSEFSRETIPYAYDDYKGLITLAPLHHFIYNGSIKIFEEPDFQSLVDSGKMFCRKTLSGKSDKLVTLLERHKEQQLSHGLNNQNERTNLPIYI
jgi:hypothetical protein